MMTIQTKAHQAFHALQPLGIALVIVLLFLIASAFPVSGFSPISFAHAMDTGNTVASVQTQSPCIAQPSVQSCTNQDPVVQGCEADAQTLAFKEFLDAHGKLLATLQRRYSSQCHSEWGRILDDGKEPLQIVVNGHARSARGSVAYSVMVFVPNLTVAPEIMGTVSTNGIDPAQSGGIGRAATIPALLPAQNQQ